jgi:hypothetical protein
MNLCIYTFLWLAELLCKKVFYLHFAKGKAIFCKRKGKNGKAMQPKNSREIIGRRNLIKYLNPL